MTEKSCGLLELKLKVGRKMYEVEQYLYVTFLFCFTGNSERLRRNSYLKNSELKRIVNMMHANFHRCRAYDAAVI